MIEASKCVRSMDLSPEQLFSVEIYSTKAPRTQNSDQKLIFKKTDLDLNLPIFEEKVNITLPKETAYYFQF